MSMTIHFSKLREHDLELGRLNEEDYQGRKKNITLMSKITKSKILK